MRGILRTLPSSALPDEALSPSQRYFLPRNALTLGRTYEVIGREGGNVVVRDDDGRDASMNPDNLLFPPVAPLSAEDAASLRDMLLSMCLDGSCYELAVAIQRGTGLPLVGLWSPTESGDDGVPGTWRHAAVRWTEGFFLDARGPVPATEFGRPFGEPEPWDVRDVDEAQLRRVRPIRDETVATLAKLAQAAWPALPWSRDAYHGRAAAFLADLEALSRRHGVWVRAPYPAARPLLAEGDEDEQGYRAEAVGGGLGVAFDRSYDPADRRAAETVRQSPQAGDTMAAMEDLPPEDASFYDGEMHVEAYADDEGIVRVSLPSDIEITPEQARRFAAGLLKAADAAEAVARAKAAST